MSFIIRGKTSFPSLPSLIKECGGTISNSTKNADVCIVGAKCSSDTFEDYKIPVVKENWALDAVAQQKKPPFKDYHFDGSKGE